MQNLVEKFEQHKKNFSLHSSYENRIQLLQSLKQSLLLHQNEIISAINADFGNRHQQETIFCELLPSIKAINYICKHLKKWLKPEKRHTHILFQPAKNQIYYQPKGVIGVMVPWNYPINLSIGPIVYALAAGNRVMVKMSEHTPKTGEALAEVFAQAFPNGEVEIINGEMEISKAFSELPFDHMLFTGSSQVGRKIMQACAKNLTPVTLELGGKSPVIIGNDINIAKVAKKIAFGKLLNAGQTCIAPDYVFCPSDKIELFIKAFQKAVAKLYPKIPTNTEYTFIINIQQFHRLENCIQDAEAKGASIHVQPSKTHVITQLPANKLLPVLISNVKSDMLIMQDEIFGPVLPILGYDKIDNAIQYINNNDKPLALYYFGNDKPEQKYVIENTSSGGVTINETLMHIVQDDLPFGGIGNSGIGHYHGIEGFKIFSHAKSVHVKQKINFTPLIYPPYSKFIQKLILKLFYK